MSYAPQINRAELREKIRQELWTGKERVELPVLRGFTDDEALVLIHEATAKEREWVRRWLVLFKTVVGFLLLLGFGVGGWYRHNVSWYLGLYLLLVQLMLWFLGWYSQRVKRAVLVAGHLSMRIRDPKLVGVLLDFLVIEPHSALDVRIGQLLPHRTTAELQTLTEPQRVALRNVVRRGTYNQKLVGDEGVVIAALLALAELKDAKGRKHALLLARWPSTPRIAEVAEECLKDW